MKTTIMLSAAAALLLGQTATAFAPPPGANMAKIGSALERMYERSANPAALAQQRLGSEVAPASQELFLGRMTVDGYTIIDAVAATDAAALQADLVALGARNVSSHNRVVSAEIPVAALGELSASGNLAFASPSLVATDVGVVTSQGDRSMRTDEIREKLGFDGEGVTIGILSDSFACDPGPLNGAGVYTTPAEDVENGDIPPDVLILSDFIEEGCIDEGRGMAHLIYDIAPKAKLAFHTAFGGQADFAEGIVELAMAGADVIVDDVIYFAEPMFQDGIIAQAADEVNALGIPYYSSNGNRARDAFEAEFEAVDTGDGVFHDFDPGPGVDTQLNVTLNGALQTNLTFQWDSPNFSVSGAPGAQNDVDVILFDGEGNRVPDCFVFQEENGFFPALCQFLFTDGGLPIDGGNGGDAIELVSLVDFTGGADVSIGFEVQSGEAPGFVKFVLFGGGFAATEYPVDAPSGFGHNNALGAEGVGAAAFYFTEEFIGDPATDTLREGAGEAPCVPACLNDFSSAGGTPIFFDVAGNRLPEPEVRLKPGITGPDGANTGFFFTDTSRDDDDGDFIFETDEPGEFPNFFGTSASAPHVAAVAALMIDAENSQILKTRRDGQVRYRMCRPIKFRGNSARKRGISLRVRPERVQLRLDRGAVFGPCFRTEADEIYAIKRETAQDMTVRASNGTGATLAVFDEVGPLGFDYDSGFGFIDAVAAINAFTGVDDDEEDEDDDDDDDDEDEDDDD